MSRYSSVTLREYGRARLHPFCNDARMLVVSRLCSCCGSGDMSEVALQICKNCGDVIGRLEAPLNWQGSSVCTLCHAKLSRAATLAPGSVPPVSAVRSSPAASPSPAPFPDGIDLRVLRDLTGQTEVRSVAEAWMIRE